MSLINDALKRAGTVRALPAEHQGGLPMQPVMEEPSPARSYGNPLTYGIAGLAVLLVIVVAGLMLKSKTSDFQEVAPTLAQANTATREAAPMMAAVAASEAAPAPAADQMISEPAPSVRVNTEAVTLQTPATAVAEVAPVPANVASVPAKDVSPRTVMPETPAAKTAPAAAVTVAQAAAAPQPATPAALAEPVAAPAQFPTLQLQAIHFRMKNSSVMINGKVVRVGQNVEGARLTAIYRYGADVTWSGQKKFLALD